VYIDVGTDLIAWMMRSLDVDDTGKVVSETVQERNVLLTVNL